MTGLDLYLDSDQGEAGCGRSGARMRTGRGEEKLKES